VELYIHQTRKNANTSFNYAARHGISSKGNVEPTRPKKKQLSELKEETGISDAPFYRWLQRNHRLLLSKARIDSS
jgi:hypothetical protein